MTPFDLWLEERLSARSLHFHPILRGLPAELRVVLFSLHYIEERLSLMSTEIDDLNVAVTGLTTAVQSATGQISTLTQEVLAASANGDHDGVEAAVAKIDTLTAQLNASVVAPSAVPTGATNPSSAPTNPPVA